MANITRREQSQQREMGRPGRARAFDPWSALMNLWQWEPGAELERMIGLPGRGFSPEFDVRETQDAYVFKADLPGVREEDLDISVTGDRITINGKREEERPGENETWYIAERPSGDFTRSFRLPEGVDAEHVEAELRNGVLTVRVPKRPEVKARKIQVGRAQAAGGAQAGGGQAAGGGGQPASGGQPAGSSRK